MFHIKGFLWKYGLIQKIENFLIRFLHLSDGNYFHYRIKLTIFYYIRLLYNIFSDKKRKKRIAYVPLNEIYDHEYWLKTYSGWNKPIYAEIEHGIYFGKGASRPIIFGIAYELKTVITYGKYREKVLREQLPDFDVYAIGPRIAYAHTDLQYKSELLKQANKAITLFPSHSIFEDNASYDVQKLIAFAKKIAQDNNIRKLRVSLREADIKNGNAEEFLKHGVEIVSADAKFLDVPAFLPRLRAIIETSSLMITNAIGTHIGYGLYLGVPQIIFPQEIAYDRNYNKVIYDKDSFAEAYSAKRQNVVQKEQELFAEIFHPSNGLTINQKQRDLCDYYWGFDQVKSPEELYAIFETIYKKFKHKK